MEWYIRKIESEDENAYLKFIEGQTESSFVSRYQWLYRGNPHGKAETWVAIEGESQNIVAATSVFPRKVWLREKIALGCAGGDTFVDPIFQRRGIATELHRVSRDGAAEAGIRFQYGLPNLENTGAHLKAGSHFPGDFQEMRILLRIEPVINKLSLSGIVPTWLSKLGSKIVWQYIKPKLSKTINWETDLKNISGFDGRFDKLMETVTPTFNICGVRDSQYLTWRYLKNPQKGHTILSYEERGALHGFAVLQFYNNRCYLFDFFVKKENELVESFISGLINFAISKGSRLITWRVNPIGPYIKHFLHCGFKIRRDTTFPLEVLVPNDDTDLEYLTNFSNWYLTFGDFDIESIQ